MKRLFIFALALLAAGCDDSVDPTVGIDAPFSIYGYLDPTADQQAIRVAPITLSIDAPDETIDAAVTSTDLATGAVTVWRDSLVAFADGTRGHVFVAGLTPTPGTTVRIEAVRSDGAAAAIDVEVPPIAVPSVAPPATVGTDQVYPVRFEGAPHVLNGQLRLTVLGLPSLPEGRPGTLVVETAARPYEVAPGVWGVEVPFVSATRQALQLEGLLDAELVLIAVDYVAFVTNQAWALPSEDPDVLVEPGYFSNVPGGLGFVGGGYRSTARWLPAPSVRAAAGFLVDVEDAGELFLNELHTGFDGGWVELYNPTLARVDLTGYSLSNDESDPRKFRFTFGTSVAPGEFKVVELPFLVAPGGYVQLFGLDRAPLGRIVAEPLYGDANATHGAFPDGHSLIVRAQAGDETLLLDLYKGPLRPTPGGPNAFGLDVAAVHEVFTEGAGGFVEVVGRDPARDASAPLVFSDREGFFEGVAPGGLAYGVAPETPGGLDLGQAGGTVYLAVHYFDPRIVEVGPTGAPLDVYRTRVVDVRSFGPQVPGRSVGYFPDLSGGWAQGLRPTPGAPNAMARLGL